MRSARFVSLLVLFAFARIALAQQPAASSPQATALLQQSMTALTGGHPLTDVTLSGTVRRIAGSDDESGTAVLRALVGTGSRIDLTLPSGPRTEIRNVASVPIAGSWSGPDGVAHAMAYHNLLTDPGWSPVFTIASLLSVQNALITYVGPETRDGQSVTHIAASQQFPLSSGDPAAIIQRLTQTNVFLDAATNLPVAVAFFLHPDGNALLDIPVEIRLSDYRPVNGTQMPFHVQKFINNCLVLDLQFNSAVLNSGLSVNSFAVGAGV